MWHDAALVAGKDLRIEARSKVTTNQVVPFALLVLFVFAFALDPDRGVLERAAPGLFWVAALFTALLAVQRSFAVEAADAGRDGLRLSGLDPAGVFLGKAGAVATALVVVEAFLAVGIVVLFGSELRGPLLLVATCALATVGLAAAGTLYAAVAAGLRVGPTLVPLLALPALTPVLLAATRASEAALAGVPSEGWPWLRVLFVFATVYAGAGVLAFGALLEEPS